jgi:hypothetical protein
MGLSPLRLLQGMVARFGTRPNWTFVQYGPQMLAQRVKQYVAGSSESSGSSLMATAGSALLTQRRVAAGHPETSRLDLGPIQRFAKPKEHQAATATSALPA